MRRAPIGFKKFAEQCIPEWFTQPHDDAQLDAMRRAAKAAMAGGMHAVAIGPQGGKSTLAMAAVLWVTFEGRREYPLLLTNDEEESAIARTLIAAARSRETHGRVYPFFEDGQVDSIWSNFAGLTRAVPGYSRAGSAEGNVLRMHTPDLIVIDDPVARAAGDAGAAELDKLLCETIPGMGGPGRKPAAILLGSPELVARIGGKGWQVE